MTVLVVIDYGDQDGEILQDDARLRAFEGWWHGEYQGWKDYPSPESAPCTGKLCVLIH